MNKSIIACAVLGTVCSVAVLATTVGPTIAATKKAKEPAPAVAGPKPAKQHSVQEQNSPLQQANKSPIPTARERQPEAIQK